MKRSRIVCVVGTRPEAVKMAPVVLRLREFGALFDTSLVATAQHRGLLDQALLAFGLRPDVDLDLMQHGQSLTDLTARALTSLGCTFESLRPDLVLGQGDTTTVLASALASHYQGIPFGHVEAGLRTGNRRAPFPEETNRVLTSHLASLHFAPTARACANLEREGINSLSIHLTGNTGIDALHGISQQVPPPPIEPPTRRFLLVTVHRRESFGLPLESILAALSTLLRRHRDLSLVWPLHPNPRVQEPVRHALGGDERAVLLDPLDYPAFVSLLKASHLVLTDSGGVQEEAPALGKPVIVVRDCTERPEAVAAGVARLAGTKAESIVAEVERLWTSQAAHAACARCISPYGDGRAAERIVRAIGAWFDADLGAAPDGLDAWPEAVRSRVA